MKFSDLKIRLAAKKQYFSAEKEDNSEEVFGVILDQQDKDCAKVFLQLKEDLKILDKNFHFLSCGSKTLMEESDFPVFLPKHVNWNGKLKDEKVIEFAGRDYDVLISFAGPENKLAALLVSLVRAKLKIGRIGSARTDKLYDLLISIKKEEPEIFIREIKKYLKQINRKTA